MSLYRSALVGLGILAMGSAASAADRTGYLSVSGGAAFTSSDVERSDVTSSVSGLSLPDSTLSLDTGYLVAPAVGVYVDNFRFEFQYTAQVHDISGLDLANGISFDNFDGSFYNNLFMLNAYYDIPLADRLSLYVGAGAGVDYVTFDGDGTNSRFSYTIDNQTGTGFAYQVMVGLEYRITPMLSVFGGYRGWSALDIDTQTSTLEVPWFNLAEVGLRLSI